MCAARENRVLVFARVAPTSSPEQCLTSVSDSSVELRRGAPHAPRRYAFDGAFWPEATQCDVFRAVAQPLVDDVLAGWNATCLAYGQTGTGKTHTMLGPALAGFVDGASQSDDEKFADDCLAGLVPRAVARIFSALSESGASSRVQVAYVQLYCEAVYDLLEGYSDGCASPSISVSLNIREDPETGVFVEGVNWVDAASAEECLQALAAGSRNRAVTATLMNAHSSRSHAIFMVRVERLSPMLVSLPPSLQSSMHESTDNQTELSASSPQSVQRGTLFLADLAGSERQSRSGVTGVHLDEMRAINLSLSALGNCIAALAARGSSTSSSSRSSFSTATANLVHVPYRDSKLTRLLQDSLGGNARTSLVVTVSAAAHSASETQATLEFGARASRVAVHAVRNEVLDYRALYFALKSTRMKGDTEKSPSTQIKDGFVLVRADELEGLRSKAKALEDEVKRIRSQVMVNDTQLASKDTPQVSQAPSTTSLLPVPPTGLGQFRDTKPAPPLATQLTKSVSASDAVTVRKVFSVPPAVLHVESLPPQQSDAAARQLVRLRADLDFARTDLDRSQAQLLESVYEQRRLRDRLREAERALTSRVAALIDEITEARASADDAERRAEAAEERAEKARSELRDLVSNEVKQADRGGVKARRENAVEEVSRLYEETITGLQRRVGNVEARAEQQVQLVQELAYRLRARDRKESLRRQMVEEGGSTFLEQQQDEGQDALLPRDALTAPPAGGGIAVAAALRQRPFSEGSGNPSRLTGLQALGFLAAHSHAIVHASARLPPFLQTQTPLLKRSGTAGGVGSLALAAQAAGVPTALDASVGSRSAALAAKNAAALGLGRR